MKKTYALIFWTLSTSGGNNTCDAFGAGGIFSRPLGLLGSSLYSSARFYHKIRDTFKEMFSCNIFVWNIWHRYFRIFDWLPERKKKKTIQNFWTKFENIWTWNIIDNYHKIKISWVILTVKKECFFNFPRMCFIMNIFYSDLN